MSDNSERQVVITGASGNTGSFVISKLIDAGIASNVLALVRPSTSVEPLHRIGVKTHVADLDNPETYLSVIEPGAFFVGIANLRFTDAMLPHLRRRGVSHAFCVTTTGVFSTYHSYSRLYREIEQRMRQTDLPLAILRPSMIYGNRRDHNMHKLIAYLQKVPIFPVFGPGTALMQPVHVEDLADGIVAAVERQAVGEYNLAGPDAIPYNQVLQDVAEALGKKVRLLHINHAAAARVVKVLERIPGFPIRHEQVMRLLEDKAFDISQAVESLDYRPRPFREGIQQQVNDQLSRSHSQD